MKLIVFIEGVGNSWEDMHVGYFKVVLEDREQQVILISIFGC